MIDSSGVSLSTIYALTIGGDSPLSPYLFMERLWASSGQRALESSRILVIGSSATSAGILKNLVLPGKRCPFTLYSQVAIHDAKGMFKMMELAKDFDFVS